MAVHQLATWPSDARVEGELRARFGERAALMNTTHVADVVYAHACHRKPPPCSAAGCIDRGLRRAVWARADAYYCARFSGDAGGLRSSQLAMLPLLREITRRLERAAASSGPRFALFSGHDTVVAPLLAAIGATSAPGACRWPPYASRVVFELWQPRARSTAGGAVVRVLFNGVPVTRHVIGCTSSPPRLLSHDLCPLEAFSNAVEALVRPHTDFTAACADVAGA